MPCLDWGGSSDSGFGGGRKRGGAQGQRHIRFTFWERKIQNICHGCMFLWFQVVRVLPGGKVEARVISERQLFLSVTNSTTNCSFLVHTSSYHGDFVSAVRSSRLSGSPTHFTCSVAKQVRAGNLTTPQATPWKKKKDWFHFHSEILTLF